MTTIFTPEFVAASLIAATTVVGLSTADAVTFPSLTTIYVGSGVTDDGGADNAGVATSFLCSNVSGITASMRVLVLNSAGSVEASQTLNNFQHGTAIAVSTHPTTIFPDLNLATGPFFGTVNIEATQSAIFCSAVIVDAATVANVGPLHLVRVNPHPGTIE